MDEDNEPITVEWLVAVGFKDCEYSLRLGTPHEDDWYHHLRHTAVAVRKHDFEWHANGIGIRKQQTRGDIRRLCSALGIPLQEG